MPVPSSRGTLAFVVCLLALSAGRGQAQEPDASAALDSLLSIPVSSAAKYEQTISQAAGAVTIITADDIASYGYRTLDQVLASVRGFYTSNDRNYTYLGVRGFSRPTDYNNRVLVLIDGNQINEGIWGGAPVELAIDLATIERIEIIRGPGSVVYGTGAMFGVINIVTRNGESVSGVQASGRAGSLGERQGSGIAGFRTRGGLDVMLTGNWQRRDGRDLFYPEYDDPASNNGVAQGLDWERATGFYGTASFRGWRIQGGRISRRKAYPTGAYGTVFNDPGAYTLDEYSSMDVRYDGPLSQRVSATLTGSYNHYWYQGDYVYPDGHYPEGGLNRRFGAHGLLRVDLTSANRLTLGAEVVRHATARYFAPLTGDPTYNLSVPYTVTSLFAQDEFQLTPTLAVTGGIGYDHFSTTGGATTMRGAIVFDPRPGTTLKLLYGEAFRAPNIYEARNETDEYRMNPSLGPERLHMVELIAQQRLGPGLLGTVSLYDYRVKGLIDLTVDPADSMFVYRNQADAEAYGLEVGLDARFGRGVRGYASYAVQRTKDQVTGTTLSNSPTHQAKAGLSVPLGRWFRPAIEGRYESRRRTVYDTYSGDYLLTNLHLLVSPPAAAAGVLGRMELSLRVDNLFDVDYATPGGVEHLQPAIRQDGRTVSVQLTTRF